MCEIFSSKTLNTNFLQIDKTIPRAACYVKYFSYGHIILQ